MTEQLNDEHHKLRALCSEIRTLIAKRDFKTCKQLIYPAMGEFPHAPEPHNLAGILLEKEGDRRLAMKHFRAAYALDPTYRPARHNLELFIMFHKKGKCAFDEHDLEGENEGDV